MLLGSPRAGGTRRSSLSTKILVASRTLLVLVAGIFVGRVQALQDQRDSARLALLVGDLMVMSQSDAGGGRRLRGGTTRIHRKEG